MKAPARLLLLAGLCVLLAACGRQTREPTDGPGRAIPMSQIQEPVPRAEPRAAYGNHSPYTVLGRTYHVLPTSNGYRERGIASWYGSKFHGRRTSSGEVYDMYKVTAAHRTLPLPTFARVRNLDNGREITVRINDRGPFHPDRVIDLSYAAALKLGIVETGTGRVEVETINFDGARPAVTAHDPLSLPVQLQVGAFRDRDRAREVQRQLERARLGPVNVERGRTSAGRVWRVRIGPLRDAAGARQAFEGVVALGLDRPVYVYSE